MFRRFLQPSKIWSLHTQYIKLTNLIRRNEGQVYTITTNQPPKAVLHPLHHPHYRDCASFWSRYPQEGHTACHFPNFTICLLHFPESAFKVMTQTYGSFNHLTLDFDNYRSWRQSGMTSTFFCTKKLSWVEYAICTHMNITTLCKVQHLMQVVQLFPRKPRGLIQTATIWDTMTSQNFLICNAKKTYKNDSTTSKTTWKEQ